MFCTSEKYLQVVAHLYRGEMNRLTIYRQRVDIISNWAISLMSALIVLYIGNDSISPYAILVLACMMMLFSFIEARRYMYYRVSQHRVRLLEEGFYAGEVFGGGSADSAFVESMTKSLRNPERTTTLLRSWATRFYRNYIWFFYVILGAWSIRARHLLETYCIIGMGVLLATGHAYASRFSLASPIDI